MKSAYLCRPVLKNEPRSSKDGWKKGKKIPK